MKITPRQAEKKLIKEMLRGPFDSISFHKDGTISGKKGYFYRHGLSTEVLESRILKDFPNAIILSSCDRWAPWPRDSYFYVRFKLVDQVKIDAEMDLELAVTEN